MDKMQSRQHVGTFRRRVQLAKQTEKYIFADFTVAKLGFANWLSGWHHACLSHIKDASIFLTYVGHNNILRRHFSNDKRLCLENIHSTEAQFEIIVVFYF